jgi:hypothetical protein
LEHNEQVVTLKPLPTLKSMRKSKILHSGARHKDFILKLAEEFSQYDEPAEGGGTRNGFAMGIVPSDAQIAAWKIDNIPIGATGYWIPWYRTPLPEDERAYVYRMYGLEGCTATIIVVSTWSSFIMTSDLFLIHMLFPRHRRAFGQDIFGNQRIRRKSTEAAPSKSVSLQLKVTSPKEQMRSSKKLPSISSMSLPLKGHMISKV